MIKIKLPWSRGKGSNNGKVNEDFLPTEREREFLEPLIEDLEGTPFRSILEAIDGADSNVLAPERRRGLAEWMRLERGRVSRENELNGKIER